MPSRPRTNPLTSDAARLTPLSIAMTRGSGAADDVGAADVRAAQRPRAGEEGLRGWGYSVSGGCIMGSYFRERLHDPGSRLLGMFVKFPTLETMEILASAGCDFVIIDMEHAPLSVDTVYGMIAVAERSGMAALVRLRGHDTATGAMLLDAGASGIFVPHCSPFEVA